MNPLSSLIANKKRTEQSGLFAKKPDEDFIPYVCHYDPNTILTKNGELMQIIRITGFNSDSVISRMISLREAVRDAVSDYAHENKFAFWFHTIRRKKNIVPAGKFDDFFSNKINEEWVSENGWDNQYVNEFYITIIIEGLDTSIGNFDSFLRSFSYLSTKSFHHKFLEEHLKKLKQIVTKILTEVEDYGAKILGIRELEGILYSEPMRFFGKISNLY